MWKNNLKIHKLKEFLNQYYVAPLIVGILLLVFGISIGSIIDHQKTKEEIEFHFYQADLFFNNGQFEEALI